LRQCGSAFENGKQTAEMGLMFTVVTLPENLECDCRATQALTIDPKDSFLDARV
jgi:hypothetical protein